MVIYIAAKILANVKAHAKLHQRQPINTSEGWNVPFANQKPDYLWYCPAHKQITRVSKMENWLENEMSGEVFARKHIKQK